MQLLSQIPETIFQVSVIGDLNIMELQPDLGTVTSQRFPDACWTWSFFTTQRFLHACRLGIFVLPLLGLGFWVWVTTSQRFPDACWGGTLSSIFVFLGSFDALKICSGSFFELRRLLATKLIGLRLATARPSLEVLSCFLLDITLCFLFWRKWLHENIEKFMMFNNLRRWSHSSRVKLPLVGMSASWFLVSTYLIWIRESKLIRSNNQSRATLWVLDISSLDFCL